MNRFIKSSIWTSSKLASISNDAEVIYYRLIPLADDHGCFPADPRILKGLITPFKESFTVDSICYQLITLCDNDLIKLWIDSKDERLYGMFPKWADHQQIRARFKRKTPSPPESIENGCQNGVVKLLQDIVIRLQQNVATLPPSPFPLHSSSLPSSKEKIMSSKLDVTAISKDEIPYEEIIEDLNSRAGRRFPDRGQATRRLIAALWKHGFRLADFILVHAGRVRVWKDDIKMREYLRPKTLYAASNFENYLGAARAEAEEPKSRRRIKTAEELQKELGE